MTDQINPAGPCRPNLFGLSALSPAGRTKAIHRKRPPPGGLGSGGPERTQGQAALPLFRPGGGMGSFLLPGGGKAEALGPIRIEPGFGFSGMAIFGMPFPTLKLFCTEMACRLADRAVQIFGGMRYMKDFPVNGFTGISAYTGFTRNQRDPAMVIARELTKELPFRESGLPLISRATLLLQLGKYSPRPPSPSITNTVL